ncbi:MAG: bifunctional aspartate kinase/homoserine dehydrogenase I [Phaeodactylibacter sp.]|nr:bifunctional aspartate kinase/homoserine dehydrogenase I [Phaeodactylibacter sp.]
MKVLKFGGSSVANAERIERVCEILRTYYEQGEQFAVVVSAMGGVTDSLINMSRLASKGKKEYLRILEEFKERHQVAARDLLGNGTKLEQVLARLKENHEVLSNLLYGIFLVREASARTMDYVLSFGERNSAFLVAHALSEKGVNAEYLDARKLIKTDKGFGAAKVDFQLTNEKIQEHFREHPAIHIGTGFIASAKGGLTTTLGRGGSDYTAAILASGLDAQLIEIWTDVNGVLTADPRKVFKTFTIPSMTYSEAMEMAHFGAKVIYPPTIQPALKKNIPIKIKNTFEPEVAGTHISNYNDPTGTAVKGISSISNVALLTLSGSGLFGVPGIAGRLFSTLAEAQINVILITQGSSEHSISFAIQPELAEAAAEKVNKTFEYEIQLGLINPLKMERELSVVAIIGENMRYRPGIAGKLFDALGKNGINAIAIAQGSSELNISVVILRRDESKALNALHQAFFLSEKQVINLYIVGVGLIGSTLLRQIKEQKAYLEEQQSMIVQVVGLANSRKMLFDPAGVDLEHWKTALDQTEEVMNLSAFIQKMKAMNLSNTIFLDNTANDQVTQFYEDILNSSISISTPNKIATSSGFAQYKRIKKIAQKRGVQFLYETNVGAGLPVLSTMKDLLNSGDEILEIQGVLSGTLSYLFNEFAKGGKFSEVLKRAMELGLTEPDPRIDLSGVDVTRKLVILAREAGGDLELNQVKLKGFLPQELLDADSVESFLALLPKHDGYFEELRAAAKAEDKVLRFIASWKDGIGESSLKSVGPESPFYTLSGSDNMIVFYSTRYYSRPLVVRGPGAGADVTAAGVFAEVLKIGHYLSH